MKSWKTTVAGILTIVSAVSGAALAFLDGNPNTNVDWTTVAAAITTGWGLIVARDNNKSSETVGAK